MVVGCAVTEPAYSKPSETVKQRQLCSYALTNEIENKEGYLMIFLSHSSVDNEVLSDLVKKLKAGGVEIWFDKDEIHPGASIPREMNKALANSDRLLIAWSQSADQSKHVWNELDAFYFKYPEPGGILFVRLDETPVPVFYKARSYIDLGSDLARDVATIMGWVTGRQDERIQEMDAESPLPATLLAFPRGPMVEAHWVTPDLVEAYAKRLPDTRAISLLEKANWLRKQADLNDPRVTIVEMERLPILGVVGASTYWQAAFFEARLNGPRMLAALLLAQPDDSFKPDIRKERARLLQRLRNLT